MKDIKSPLDRLKIDPAASARAQAWYETLAARHRREWPKLREELLAAAQRAQAVRHIPLV